MPSLPPPSSTARTAPSRFPIRCYAATAARDHGGLIDLDAAEQELDAGEDADGDGLLFGEAGGGGRGGGRGGGVLVLGGAVDLVEEVEMLVAWRTTWDDG